MRETSEIAERYPSSSDSDDEDEPALRAKGPARRDGRGQIRLVHPSLDSVLARSRTTARDDDRRPAAGGPPTDARRGCLIGREAELEELHAALGAALAGSGSMVLLGGEPGIGKTRLAGALAEDGASRGVPVWWGRGREDGSAPAFWPWNAGLRRWIDQVGRDAVLEAAGSWKCELAHVFPVLRDPTCDAAPAVSAESEGARFRLFDIVSRFLATVARESGLILVLDDAHWADHDSLRLLEFLASELGETRILVVATYRDNELRRETPLASTLSRLAREPRARRLLLDGLSPAQCARWIDSAGIASDAAVLGEALHRETNGNPFFLSELVRLLASEKSFPRSWHAQRVPQGTRDVIGRRLDRLGDGCRAMLEVAALLGDSIDVQVLSELVPDASPADELARAERDRILVESDAEPGRLRFAHALIRKVLIDDLPPSARAGWHARIAAVLEQHASAANVIPTELVRHFAAAGTRAAQEKAFEYACRGAEQAARGLGWEEAVRLYEIALDAGRRSGLLDARRALEIRLALARALRGAGAIPEARAQCDLVIAACRLTPDPASLARAALIHAGPIPGWGRVEPAVRAVLEEACRAGHSLDDELRARVYARLAGDLIAANEVDQGARVLSLCEEAAAAARRAGADGALAIALLGTYTAAVVELRPADATRDWSHADEALATAERSGEHEYGAVLRYLRAMMRFAAGEHEAFASEVDDLATAAAESRVPEALWLTDALTALRATLQGRFEEGRAAMERALATGQRAQLANAIGVYAGQRIMWHALQGRLAEIAPELDFFVDANSMGAGWRPFRALARLAAGDAVAARAEYHELLAAGLAPTERGVMARTYLVGLATLCVALREREHASMLYDVIARRDDVWSIGGGQTLGPWALVLGGLARLCGRLDDATRHFETAIRLGRTAGSRPFVARAQSHLASVRLSTTPSPAERERITEVLAEAAQCARELGLADVEARTTRLQAKVQLARAAPSANVFRYDGDVWSVSFGDRSLRVRDGKGPRYLAALLAAPEREIHVLELAGALEAATSLVPEGLTVGGPGGELEDAPDLRAAREYRARVSELRAELEEAESMCDLGRAERLRTELDLISAQLGQRFGSHVRTRGPAETARKAVTKVLRQQIARLVEARVPLGEHLRESIRMGTFCSYVPRAPTAWDVTFPS